MARELGRLEVTTLCENCDDFRQAHAVDDNLNRCTECGAFATDDPDVCCVFHELRSSPYPSDECPYCVEEQRIQAELQHMATRDPLVEPY